MPHVWGPEHIIYLAVCAAICTILLVIIRRKATTERATDTAVRIIAATLLVAVMSNRVTLAAVNESVTCLIPDSFCGLSSFLFALAALFGRRDNIVLHCVAYIGAVGGLLTVAYPDFIGQADSIFYSCTITGLLHHTIMLFLFITVLMTGFLKPTWRKWYAIPLGGCVYVTFGLFMNQVLGATSSMYIGEPILAGTGMYWYVLVPLFCAVYAVFITVWELCAAARRRKKSE